MKNFIIRLLIFCIAISSFSLQTTFASFSDLSTSHSNYDAIIYLQENDILDGYPDGTFRADNSVNRAEFLKIIIEGSEIPLDVNQNTPFTDVDHNAWYAPYIKKAYKEGWVIGYGDKTFRPAQTINKVEALKILGEVQNWQLEERVAEHPYLDVFKASWYAPYVAYAKERNYLEETGNYFYPAELMSRAKISEVIYRTIAPNPVITPKDDTTPLQETEMDFAETVAVDSSIEKNFYEGVTLEENIPAQFFKNEVYIIEGSANTETVTVLLEKTGSSYFKTFTDELENNHFEIPIFFNESGDYLIGILPGESGQSKAAEIEVSYNLPVSTGSGSNISSSNLSINYANDETYIKFSSPEPSIKKLTISQGGNSVSYLSRQDKGKIPLQYKDFKNFNEGTVSYKLETASLESEIPLKISSDFTSSSEKTFSATEHSFDYINKSEITINPPDILASTNSFSITATTKTDTNKIGYITKPDGFVEEVELDSSAQTEEYFGQELIGSGETISFNYDPSTTGRYIIEINNKEGIALVNHPIYIGAKIPLIPDFFDLNEREFFGGSFNLTALRTELLNLINSERTKHGLSTINTSTELNSLAQSHSDDMAENSYFSHINLDNQSPDDRRIEAGISTPVSENIAKDTSIPFGHHGLMRSGAHRINILKPDWDKVGLGITVSSDAKYLIIAEEFSSKEITAQDLENYKTELLSEINAVRSAENITELSYDLAIESASKYLNDKVIQEGATLNNSIFSEALETNDVIGSSQAIGRIFNLWPEILDSIINDEIEILNSDWEKTGIDIQLDASGRINTILILNQP